MWNSYTVCVSSTENALSTSSALREVIGVTSTAAAIDAAQLSAIRRATEWAIGYIGHDIRLQTYNEVVPSFGGSVLTLSHIPIRSIARMFDATDTGSASAICSSEYRLDDADAGLLSRPEGFAWTADVGFGLTGYPVPGSERRPWLVEYLAGWTLDGLSTDSENYSTGGKGGSTSTGRTLPTDVELAILLKASDLLTVGKVGMVESEKVGDLSVTYRTRSCGEPSEAEQILRRYRA